jgi:peptidoglycan/xylan/chitin deacetylase (PgdA/CDA1 family)
VNLFFGREDIMRRRKIIKLSGNKTQLKLQNKQWQFLCGAVVLLMVLAVLVEYKVHKKTIETSGMEITEETTTEEESEEEEEEETGQGEYPDEKKVYLTFDDGPSVNTQQILDILDYYDVKATFFTITNTSESAIESMKRILESGNTLAIHSVSHEYSAVYGSIEDFQDDVLGQQQFIYENTGYKTWFYRFPGGSSTSKAVCGMDNCIDFLDEEGFEYFDWNVDSGDASGNNIPAETIIDNVLSAIGSGDEYIVLMHDAPAKSTTVEALPAIIESLLEDGYKILPITKNTEPIHHRHQ